MTLRRWLGLPPTRRHVLPDGLRVYAIGDVHGCLALLRPLLGWIADDDARRGGGCEVHVILLGDLIDRGPDSRGVLDLLAEPQATPGTRHLLRGNHEEMLLAILDGDLNAAGDWLGHGGAETLESYGVDPALYWHDPEAFIPAIRAAIPAAHVALLRGMLSQVRIGDYLFVHAGIRPGVPFDAQSGRDLRWIRADFLDSKVDHGAMVVHGHTIAPAAQFRHNRIGIDTGAYRTGRLTALGLEGASRWTLTSRNDAG